jgi:AcrR family transcriptional regulator
LATIRQHYYDARRDSILDAAKRLFIRNGVGNATMQEIAEEADLSAGAIYRYFLNKEDLLQAFFEHCVAEGPVSLINQAAPADLPARERLKAAVRMVREIWREQGPDMVIGVMEVSLASIRQPDEIGSLATKSHERVHDAIQAIIEEGQATGDIAPNLDARAVAMNLYAFVFGIGMMGLNQPEEYDAMFGAFYDIVDRLGPCQ